MPAVLIAVALRASRQQSAHGAFPNRGVGQRKIAYNVRIRVSPNARGVPLRMPMSTRTRAGGTMEISCTPGAYSLRRLESVISV